MLNDNLLARAEEVFKEIGGYSAAKNYFSDNEITDICLFNGYTVILFPYYTAIGTEADDGLDLYNLIDLSAIGCDDQSYYSILDRHFDIVYTDKPVIKEILGSDVLVYGSSEKDKDFYSLTMEGELYFILYQNDGGPTLAQLIISHKLPQPVVSVNIKRWEEQLAKQDDQFIGNNELIIYLNGLKDITLYLVRGKLSDNYSEERLIYGPERTVSQYITSNPIFMSLDSGVWLSFRLYAEYEEEGLELLIGTAAETAILDMGYIKVYTEETYRAIYTKALGDGYIVEIDAEYYAEEILSGYTTRKYMPLKLTNIIGARTESIKELGNHYFLHNKTTELDLVNSVNISSSVSAMSRVNRKPFKLETTLSINDV